MTTRQMGPRVKRGAACKHVIVSCTCHCGVHYLGNGAASLSQTVTQKQARAEKKGTVRVCVNTLQYSV